MLQTLFQKKCRQVKTHKQRDNPCMTGEQSTKERDETHYDQVTKTCSESKKNINGDRDWSTSPCDPVEDLAQMQCSNRDT